MRTFVSWQCARRSRCGRAGGQVGGAARSRPRSSTARRSTAGKATAKICRVEDGAIVGGSLDNKVARNEFLCTTRDLRRLRAEAEVQAARRRRRQRRRAVPHQAHPQQSRGQRLPGGHGRRLVGQALRRVAPQQGAGRTGSGEDEGRHQGQRLERLRDPCEGKHIQLWVNGIQTVDYTEDGCRRSTPPASSPCRSTAAPRARRRYKDITIVDLTK